MEDADVLARPEPDHKNSIFNLDNLTSRVTSFFKPKDLVPQGKKQADINIFTVASGLLYEEFIPHFAEKYKFKYELVTYKWPPWLREQTEKQRIIWTYKILFLDVLFPMDLKKVIFVGADQIVRADLKELVTWIYTARLSGILRWATIIQIWKALGFGRPVIVKDFLRGLPYHISLAEGNSERIYYEDIINSSLRILILLQSWIKRSSDRKTDICLIDGNSCFGQFSLPEDWLWIINHSDCHTSAKPGVSPFLDVIGFSGVYASPGSKDRLHRAKSIDLCQNPLTKEPKLSRARQIPEWE
ncbi:hypothetical protein H0H93_005572, partial [Arthromyces matolae]